MPKITALLHTHNDALHLGRVLDSLHPCDEVLVIDECSDDETRRIAREHGATIKDMIPGVTPGAYAMDASHDWILCLRPNESLSDDLEAALFEWKNREVHKDVVCYQVSIRQEKKGGKWKAAAPETRLVNRKLLNWVGEIPPHEDCEALLDGDLLCFHQP